MKNKMYLILKIAIMLIVAGLSVYSVVIINNLDILPNNYMYTLIGILVLLNALGGLCIFIKKWYTYVLSAIMYLLVIVLSVVGIKYGGETNDFLENSFSTFKEEVTTFYVLVKNDSTYNELSDLNGLDISYFSFYNNVDEIKGEINKKVTGAKFTEENDLYDTYIRLIDGEITSLIIDEGYMGVLSEEFEDLDTSVRKLYTFNVETKVEVKVESNLDKVALPTESINIYISGSDSRSVEISSRSRTDVNMIVTINPSTKTVLLTSIPRDYYVQVHGTTGLRDKLTHTGIYGIETSKATLEDLFGIEIDYSIKTGFSAVVELVDLVGGIEVYSDTEFDSFHIKGWHVNEGINYMDGEKALAYARERYAYIGGDRHRILNQQQVLEATLKKILVDKTILLKYERLLQSLSKFYVTDIPREVISSYIKMQLSDMSSWTFISQSVDGSGASEPTYTSPSFKAYVMVPYSEDVKNASIKIESVLEGTYKEDTLEEETSEN